MSDRVRNLIVATCMVVITISYLKMIRTLNQSTSDTDRAFATLRSKLTEGLEQ